MKIKIYSICTLLAGLLITVLGIVMPFIRLRNYTGQNGAIGIIGGADTPTYKFITFTVMNGWPFVSILFGATLVVSALFCLIFSKTVKNHCAIKTSAISLGLSFTGALGLTCFFAWLVIASFGETYQHPIRVPFVVLLGVLSLVAFAFLIVIYLKTRKENRSVKGLVLDILTSIIFLPAFFFAFSYLYGMI